MVQIKEFLYDLIYGFSSFSINAKSDYTSFIPASSDVIMQEAWTQTGNSLCATMNSIVEGHE